MNLNLRQAIYERVKDKSQEELHDVVESSIDTDERTLPGLGVLFEVIWKNSETNVQNELINTLKTNLPH